MRLCTLTPKICYYYHLPLHRAITNAVQMTAPVLEIMDTALYQDNIETCLQSSGI
jgi:hypothetical protein